MEATHTNAHTHEAHAHPDNTKAIWRTLGILTIITVAELIVGMFIAPDIIKQKPGMKIIFNSFYLICTLAKAFYIVAEFMHLRHEIKNLIMTIVFPLLLFVWFIIAFLWDGDSYLKLRKNNNPKIEKKATVPPVQEGGHH
jgi:cytochrome c oxidase subunit IV